MSKKIIWPLAVLVICGAISYVVLKTGPKPKKEDQAVVLPTVEVLTLETITYQYEIDAQGSVQPLREIDLVAEVSGKITDLDVEFKSGGSFAEKTLLVNVEERDYLLAIASAEARVAEAEQRLQKERAESAQAEKEWQRLGRGNASKLALRKPQLAEAEAKYQSAKAELDKAKLQHERTQIRSPFSGRVKEKFVDLGQYVTPGMPLARIYSDDVIEVRLPLTNQQLAYINEGLLKDLPEDERNESMGTKVTLSTEVAGEKRRWLGFIDRVERNFDTRTRTITAVARFDNRTLGPDDIPLMVGLFVEAQIEGRMFPEVFAVPTNALYGEKTMFVVDEENRLQKREVNIIRTTADYLVLAGGVAKGERLAVSKVGQPVTGMAVKVRESSASQANTYRLNP